MLNLFYKEIDADRWVPGDRFPRRAIRRVARGARQPGGMERYFVNLIDGLRRSNIAYRTNAFHRARRHPNQVVGIVGKAHLLRQYPWRNPILFGPAVPSHPIDDLAIYHEVPIKMVLVSCRWLKTMYEAQIQVPITVWPAGVDTYTWSPSLKTEEKDIDVLVYDKIRWQREIYEPALLNPILAHLHQARQRYCVVRYGFYREEEFRQLLSRSRAMVFLAEHETQGFAYLQSLSCDVPILAWDRGGYWQDPAYYPDRVKFGPVTSVPYWDDRCGARFNDMKEFASKWSCFWDDVVGSRFRPRDYVVQNLSLEKCAREYLELASQLGDLD